MIEIMIILRQRSNVNIEFLNIAEDSSASFRKEPNPLFLVRIRINISRHGISAAIDEQVNSADIQ